MEKTKKRMIIILIVIIVLVLSAIIFLSITKKDEIKKKITEMKESSSTEETSEDLGINTQNENEQTETNAGGGGGDGDSAGSSSQSTPSSNCQERQISYSMINPNKTSICNEYLGEICINKTTICSIEIENRDNEIGGLFKIEIIFVEKDLGRESGFYSEPLEYYIEPREKQIFEASTNIQSTGEEGLANKEINCFYTTKEIPKEQIC
jgi:hypothetical protein